MPTETVTTNEHVTLEGVPKVARSLSREDEGLRKLALRHLERVRKLKFYASAYLLALLVLTPIWIVTEYMNADGWPEHLSSRSRYPGDWDPWIIWVALIGAFLVGLAALRAYAFRGETEADVEREIARLKSKR